MNSLNLNRAVLILVFYAIFMLSAATTASAQEGRIVCVRLNDVFLQSDEYKEAEEVFTKEQEAWEQEGEAMQRALDSLRRDLDKQRLILSPDRLKQKEDEIETKAAALQKFINDVYGPGGKGEQRNQQLVKPIMDKITQVIEKIALENDYSMVLDVANANIIYAKQTLDITDKVIEELSQVE